MRRPPGGRGPPHLRAKPLRCAYVERRPVIRWMIVIFLALLLISWFSPLLGKLGFGRLPGDLRFRLFGREWFIPLTTTILLSMVASLVSKAL